ncbi:hypothetical protein GCM10020369_44110 [Cryptosporangium minutisporangium]|uniref:PsrA tetracyclin repressor-like C-terminal domain-containing protein n=2 Tax=Cryptosporangium minutisporangium TaxID=113569 RepID=A0ABP6T0W9_9ACTN
MQPVNAERVLRLRALQAQDGAPSVEQVVRAFVEPGLLLDSHHSDRRPAVARFIGRVLFDPSARIRQLFADQVDPVEGRFLDALGAALPDQDADTVRFGYTSMLGLLALHQAATFSAIKCRPAEGKGAASEAPSSDEGLACERLVGFLTAGLTHGLRPTKNHGPS